MRWGPKEKGKGMKKKDHLMKVICIIHESPNELLPFSHSSPSLNKLTLNIWSVMIFISLFFSFSSEYTNCIFWINRFASFQPNRNHCHYIGPTRGMMMDEIIPFDYRIIFTSNEDRFLLCMWTRSVDIKRFMRLLDIWLEKNKVSV